MQRSKLGTQGALLAAVIGVVLTSVACFMHTNATGSTPWLAALFGVLATGVVSSSFYSAVSKSEEYFNNWQSMDRMEELSQLMEAYLGPMWRYNMYAWFVAVTVILGLLYLLSRTGRVEIQDTPKIRWLMWFVAAAVSALAIAIISAAAVYQSIEHREANQSLFAARLQGYSSQTSVGNTTLMYSAIAGTSAIVLGLFALIAFPSRADA
jgi:hypothetical protein